MSLSGGTEVRLDAEVDLDAVTFEPAAAASGEVCRLWSFGDPEQSGIKGPCLGFPACGHCQLNMIERLDRHATHLRSASIARQAACGCLSPWLATASMQDRAALVSKARGHRRAVHAAAAAGGGWPPATIWTRRADQVANAGTREWGWPALTHSAGISNLHVTPSPANMRSTSPPSS